MLALSHSESGVELKIHPWLHLLLSRMYRLLCLEVCTYIHTKYSGGQELQMGLHLGASITPLVILGVTAGGPKYGGVIPLASAPTDRYVAGVDHDLPVVSSVYL